MTTHLCSPICFTASNKDSVANGCLGSFSAELIALDTILPNNSFLSSAEAVYMLDKFIDDPILCEKLSSHSFFAVMYDDITTVNLGDDTINTKDIVAALTEPLYIVDNKLCGDFDLLATPKGKKLYKILTDKITDVFVSLVVSGDLSFDSDKVAHIHNAYPVNIFITYEGDLK